MSWMRPFKALGGIHQYQNIVVVQEDSTDDYHYEIYSEDFKTCIGDFVIGEIETGILSLNDITVYDEGKGVAVSVLSLLFSLGAKEIRGESLPTAESYWQQYTPLISGFSIGEFKTFTIREEQLRQSYPYKKFVMKEMI